MTAAALALSGGQAERAAWRNRALLVVAALVFLTFYLPIRFYVPVPGGAGAWLVVQGLLGVGLAAVGFGIAARSRTLLARDLIVLLLVAYLTVMVLATTLLQGAFVALQGLRVYVLPVGLYFLGRTFSDPRDRRVLLYGFLLSAAGVALFYTADYLYFYVLGGGRPLSSPWISDIFAVGFGFGSGRITGQTGGVFGYPHPNGVMAAAGAAVCLGLLLLSPAGALSGTRRLALGLGVLVCVLPGMLGASRISIFLFALVLLLLLWRVKRAGRSLAPAAGTLFLLVLPAVGLFLLYAVTSPAKLESVYQSLLFWQRGGVLTDYSVALRAALSDLRSAYHGEYALLLSGTGFATPGSDPTVFGNFQSNDYWHLQLISQFGLVGYALWCALPVWSLVSLVRRSPLGDAGAGMPAFLCLLAVAVMFASSWHSATLTFFGVSYWYYVLLGAGAGSLRVGRTAGGTLVRAVREAGA
jgi:hypothetical protein